MNSPDTPAPATTTRNSRSAITPHKIVSDRIRALAERARLCGGREGPMDTVIADDSRLPADIDAQPLVQAALALRPELRRYKDEIESEQRMPPALFEQLREAGFY